MDGVEEEGESCAVAGAGREYYGVTGTSGSKLFEACSRRVGNTTGGAAWRHAMHIPASERDKLPPPPPPPPPRPPTHSPTLLPLATAPAA
jgi:hypothetical protein